MQHESGNALTVSAPYIFKAIRKAGINMANRQRVHELFGVKVGSLTVVEKVKTKYKGVAGWKCVCDCGNECIKTTHQLVSVLNGEHKYISCGCNRNRGESLVGRRFGRLVVIEKASNKGRTTWRCKCDCGTEKIISREKLTTGHTCSCGCLESENRKTLWMRSHSGRAIKHGERSRRYNERLYNVWNGMKTRCTNPNAKSYRAYGGRGITVCDEWLHNFPAFQEWAITHGYDETAPFGECTIDRIDVNGNYEPSNCRWVSMEVQQTNKR